MNRRHRGIDINTLATASSSILHPQNQPNGFSTQNTISRHYHFTKTPRKKHDPTPSFSHKMSWTYQPERQHYTTWTCPAHNQQWVMPTHTSGKIYPPRQRQGPPPVVVVPVNTMPPATIIPVPVMPPPTTNMVCGVPLPPSQNPNWPHRTYAGEPPPRLGHRGHCPTASKRRKKYYRG